MSCYPQREGLSLRLQNKSNCKGYPTSNILLMLESTPAEGARSRRSPLDPYPLGSRLSKVTRCRHLSERKIGDVSTLFAIFRQGSSSRDGSDGIEDKGQKNRKFCSRLEGNSDRRRKHHASSTSRDRQTQAQKQVSTKSN